MKVASLEWRHCDSVVAFIFFLRLDWRTEVLGVQGDLEARTKKFLTRPMRTWRLGWSRPMIDVVSRSSSSTPCTEI